MSSPRMKYDTNCYRDLPGLLPDHLIRNLIGIEPFAEGIKREGIISYGLSSSGYDVRLGTKFKIFSNAMCAKIDPKNLDPKAFVEWEGDHCWIPGNGYILGESVEKFTIPRDIACICLGKSTYARCGIMVNVTPGEPEWVGKWTIEISNNAPVPAKVYANEGIMQCLFFRTVTECEVSYADKKGKYQDAVGLAHAQVDRVDPAAPGQDRTVVTTNDGGGYGTQIRKDIETDGVEIIRLPCYMCSTVRMFVVPNHGGHNGKRVCIECGHPHLTTANEDKEE